jgi:peptide/nickel transport system ATP-binding protein
VSVLRIDELSVDYGRRRGPLAVDRLSLAIEPGQTLGIVGESGSGKSTVGLAALGLIPISGGSVQLDGRDLARLRGARLREARAHASMIFQSSSASLDPRRTVGWSIAEPLLARAVAGAKRRDRVHELLVDVGLEPTMATRYPHELSGGQKQRVGIARALAADPVLLICDEPTSALDVSVQAQIVNLLIKLQDERGLAMMFITHDLAVVEAVSHWIAVMRSGRIVEQGAAERVLRSPESQYTRQLLAAVPGTTHKEARP